MTIEELVKVIAETVQKYLLLESQKVLALYFDDANKAELLEAALGLAFTPWGRLAGAMLSRGKPVFQLKKAPAESSPACRKMMKTYWARLAGLGVVLLDTKEKNSPAKTVFRKNVLSRRDLYGYKNTGRLIIGRGVVVTTLAAEAAKAMNIEIVRQE
jgi:hypothetical protein